MVKSTYIRQLRLYNFRSYRKAIIDSDSSFVIFTGSNGSGKTNILEAIGSFFPGRGLRGAKLSELLYNNNIDNSYLSEESYSDVDIANKRALMRKDLSVSSRDIWSVNAEVVDSGVSTSLAVVRSISQDNDRKLLYVNGDLCKDQAEVTDLMSCHWLSPNMDGIFMEGQAIQRRFFDRMIYAYDKMHMNRLSSYEHSLRERLLILRNAYENSRKVDERWLAIIERNIAQKAVAIAALRNDFLDKLNLFCKEPHDKFSGAIVIIRGLIEDMLKKSSALEVEDFFCERLKKNREQDFRSRGTREGIHRSRYIIIHNNKHQEAKYCSTGEQKILLFSIMMAQVNLLRTLKQQMPILLLDDVVAHLDAEHRAALLDFLVKMKLQCWFTFPEALELNFMEKNSLLSYKVANGLITPS